MNNIRNLETKKLKRKNFFMYLGVAALGLLGISKIPLKRLFTKIEKESVASNAIKIKENPLSVKREMSSRNG